MGTINDTLEMRTQTIGRAVEHCEVKVVDADGNVVPVNEPGELLVRGYQTMIGYWQDKKKTEETYTGDRYLRTGYFLLFPFFSMKQFKFIFSSIKILK